MQRRLCINRGLAKLLNIEDCEQLKVQGGFLSAANRKEWFAVTEEMAGQHEDKERQDSGEAHAEESEKSADSKG